MAETLLLSAGFALAVAVLYTVVGRKIQTRVVAERHRLANTMFATWWYGLGLTTAIGGCLGAAYYLGQTDVTLHFAVGLLNIFIICVALLGLLYYLLFLYTGKSSILGPLVVGYVLYFFLLVYFLLEQQPNGVTSDGWTTRLAYARPDTGPLFGIVIVLLIFPQILGAIALLLLSFKVEDRERRFRSIVVSASIIVWFGSAFIGVALKISQEPYWQVTSRIIGLAAAIAILVAYRPPEALRRRIARSSTSDASAPAPQERASSAGFRSTARSNPSETAW